jgi:hypothetical protein
MVLDSASQLEITIPDDLDILSNTVLLDATCLLDLQEDSAVLQFLHFWTSSKYALYVVGTLSESESLSLKSRFPSIQFLSHQSLSMSGEFSESLQVFAEPLIEATKYTKTLPPNSFVTSSSEVLRYLLSLADAADCQFSLHALSNSYLLTLNSS